jgi:hypothetical protein
MLVQPPNHLPLYRFPCSTHSWIAPVGHFLSQNWIDMTQITTKAAKRDDDQPATAMRDKRLLLLYPCYAAALHVLREWLLGIVWRNVLQGLRMYLSHEHGTSWGANLTLCRRLRCRHLCSREFRDAVNASLRLQGGG